MTRKFTAFAKALRALCREHDVQLAADGSCIQVFDMPDAKLTEGKDPIYLGLITDFTRPALDAAIDAARKA